MCYAPWVLLAWVHALRGRSFRDVLRWIPLHVIASIALFNSGAMKEGVILLGTLNGAGLLALLLRPLPWRERLGPVAAMLAANAVFALVAAPFWMTFVDLLANARTIYDKMEVYQNQPSLLVGLFDDLFPRQLCRAEEHFDPSGNFLLLLGVLWSLVRARSLAREPLWLACVIAAACALAFAFGVVPPSWIAAMPFLGKIWHVDNCFSVAAIVLTFVLAAFGLRDCLDRRNDPAWRGDFVMFCIAVGALYASYFGFTHAAHRSGLSLLAVGNTVAKSPFFIGYATALAAAVIALPLLWRRSAQTGLGTGGWLAVAAALFAIHFRHAYYAEVKFDAYVMSPQERPDFHAKSAAIEKIRGMIATSHAPSRIVGTYMNLTPSFNAVYGLESPFSCDAVSNRWLSARVALARVHLGTAAPGAPARARHVRRALRGRHTRRECTRNPRLHVACPHGHAAPRKPLRMAARILHRSHSDLRGAGRTHGIREEQARPPSRRSAARHARPCGIEK